MEANIAALVVEHVNIEVPEAVDHLIVYQGNNDVC